jgi:hypothetical protein
VYRRVSSKSSAVRKRQQQSVAKPMFQSNANDLQSIKPIPERAILSIIKNKLSLPEEMLPQAPRPADTDILAITKEIGFTPTFTTPLAEYLKALGEELVLPGVGKVNPDTIGILQTNRRFIEAFLCGCNHAFAAELLWRSYPSDLRGTFFRQFWNRSGFIPTQAEIMQIESLWLRKKGYKNWSEVPMLLKNKLLQPKDFQLPILEQNRQLQKAVVREYLTEQMGDIIPIDQWGNNKLGENVGNFEKKQQYNFTD